MAGIAESPHGPKRATPGPGPGMLRFQFQCRIDPWGNPILECSRCKSNKDVDPNLQLQFSTCCGLVVCSACVQLYFSGKGQTCQGCGAEPKRNAFSDRPFEQQLYEQEIQFRSRLARIYNRKEGSFASTKEFYDYLEEVESLVYNKIHGTAQEKEQADIQIQEYQKRANEAIQRQHRARDLAQQTRQQQQQQQIMRGMVPSTGIAAPQTAGFNLRTSIMSTVAAPQSASHSSGPAGGSAVVDAEQQNRLASMTSEERKEYERQRRNQQQQLKERGMRAGGFNPRDVRGRQDQEFFGSVFFFPEPPCLDLP